MHEGSRRFGSYLRAMREARRLTLIDVERMSAREAEPITRSLLSRLENGKAKISALKLLALARLYRTPIGLLAERLEIDFDAAVMESESCESWSTDKLLTTAAQAGAAGQIHRALVLYETAETRESSAAPGGAARARARLGVCRALYASGKLRLARDQVEDLLSEPLPDGQRSWALYFLAKIALDLDQTLLAQAAEKELNATPAPRPDEIEACLPYFEAELLSRKERWDDAVEAWLRALDAARRFAQPGAEARAQLRLAGCERERGRLSQAVDWCARSIETTETHGLAQVRVLALTEEGRLHLARKRKDLARQTWARARRLARSLDLHRDLFGLYVETWRLATHEGDEDQARSALGAMRSLLRFIDYVPQSMRDVRDHVYAASDDAASEAAEEAF